MDVDASLRAPLDRAALFAVVADLGTYPRWLDIVTRAVPVDAYDADEGPAWSIDLRGQLGPLRRSKRLRMVRTSSTDREAVRFERRELDGKDHSAWVLDGTIATDGDDTVLSMHLHYGGSLWIPLLDKVLRDEIERSRTRLVEVASATS